jgi:uncharacterized protein
VPAQESPATLADGVEHPLDPSWIELQRLVGWIVFAVVSPALLLTILVVALTSRVTRIDLALLGAAWILVTILLVWVAHAWPEKEYRRFRYRVHPDGLEIGRGVWWRRLISVPRSRVQHIDVAQGPIERRFDLATLSIHTAGTHFARVDLPGLRYPRAVSLRDYLLPGSEQARDDGT